MRRQYSCMAVTSASIRTNFSWTIWNLHQGLAKLWVRWACVGKGGVVSPRRRGRAPSTRHVRPGRLEARPPGVLEGVWVPGRRSRGWHTDVGEVDVGLPQGRSERHPCPRSPVRRHVLPSRRGNPLTCMSSASRARIQRPPHRRACRCRSSASPPLITNESPFCCVLSVSSATATPTAHQVRRGRCDRARSTRSHLRQPPLLLNLRPMHGDRAHRQPRLHRASERPLGCRHHGSRALMFTRPAVVVIGGQP